MDAGIITALITAFVGLSVSGITWWSTRQRNSAEAYDKLSATVERQDARLERFRVEVDAMRNKWEAEVNVLRARVAHLEAENEKQRGSMRRLINQLRREKIKPDLDPADIEELFKGT